MNAFVTRLADFRNRLSDNDIDIALITDDDNLYYLTGYHDYLHMEFGRPTILVVSKDAESVLITPEIDFNTAVASANVDRIAPWNDGMGKEWREEIPNLINGADKIGLEPDLMPPRVRLFINQLVGASVISSVTPLLEDMRMIKSEEELQIARHAGQVAIAMMLAAQSAISDGTPEYEVALAASQAGTRTAAQLLATHYANDDMSPNTQFLQIMASGEAITKTHHRATNRIMQKGDPVFMCFCGMTNFHRFKLGFDRTFWIGEIARKSQQRIYEIAVSSQKAALEVLGPGVSAESVHAAYAEVIQTAGFEYPFRCGRATGFSFLEKPQLVTGDKTILRPGMVLAVDGSVSDRGFRAQVGDSFIITEEGYEALTDHPKEIDEVIV